MTLAACALLAACGGSRDAWVRAPDRRAMVRLERQAQREMHCRAGLQISAIEPAAFRVSGCGQLREYAYVCSGRRCAFQPIVPAIMRASADLQCAPEMLTALADGAAHLAFFGCTHGAAYRLVCLDRGCTWSRTEESVSMAAPPPPPMLDVVTADPSLEAAVIPPPPGAASAFTGSEQAIVPTPPASTAPPPSSTPPSSAPPPSSTSTAVVPPPPGAAPTPAPTDTVVIPPPPS